MQEIWLTYFGLIVMTSYPAWIAGSPLLEWRAEDPRLPFWDRVNADWRWGRAVLGAGIAAVVLAGFLVLITVTRFDLVLSTSPAEWLVLALSLVAYAATFIGFRALLLRFVTRWWVRILAFNGFIVAAYAFVAVLLIVLAPQPS